MAWWGLANIKTLRLEPSDVERMRRTLQDANASDDDRIATGFALAKALEDDGRLAEALRALAQANDIARRRRGWNAATFSAGIDTMMKAFAASSTIAETPERGFDVVFIVGLPRSGTTLVEQIPASHSKVEGAGELFDPLLVLAEESRRRSTPFTQWVPEMRSSDWRQLGERYLERTARWRVRRPIFTDKLPSNWVNIGAIRTMLPGACIVICRRDPLETCFSCYRQHMAGNEYTRTFEDLARFWRDFDRIANRWTALHPSHVYQHECEALIAGPERGIRKLLDFCRLPFDESCLRFHETNRDVRSPSATQVRQPLRSDTARGQRHGALLDPLRAALGLPLFET